MRINGAVVPVTDVTAMPFWIMFAHFQTCRFKMIKSIKLLNQIIIYLWETYNLACILLQNETKLWILWLFYCTIPLSARVRLNLRYVPLRCFHIVSTSTLEYILIGFHKSIHCLHPQSKMFTEASQQDFYVLKSFSKTLSYTIVQKFGVGKDY